MKKADFLTLVKKDYIKGFLVAILTVLLTGVYNIIITGELPDSSEWKAIGVSSLGAGIAYLLKNFFTNSDDEFAKKEP